MRDQWASSEPTRSQGLAGNNDNNDNNRNRNRMSSHSSLLAAKAMRLKLSGQVSREVSERRQVGDAEEMFAESEGEKPWWRSVGIEEM